jgi:hypothetical protein
MAKLFVIAGLGGELPEMGAFSPRSDDFPKAGVEGSNPFLGSTFRLFFATSHRIRRVGGRT